MILAVAAGLLIKGYEIELPQLVTNPIKIVAGAYIAIALLTLGVQLAETKFSLSRGPVWLAVGMKVLLAIFCTEYKRAPEVAGTIVLVSTLLSPLTVTAWIWLLRFSW